MEQSEGMGTRGPQPMKISLSNSLSAVFGCGLFFLALATWASNPVLCAEKVGSRGPIKGADMTDKDQLTAEEGQHLLSVARQTIEEALFQNMNERTEDPGFSPKFSERRGTFVTLTNRIQIEVSILTEPKPLPYRDEEDLLMKLRPGVDGLIIQKGGRQATFLPQVWEQLTDKKEFLTHLCLKAGLDADEWKRGELRVSTYQVQAFEEE
jgi:AMMECR1 domain-containing protein